MNGSGGRSQKFVIGGIIFAAVASLLIAAVRALRPEPADPAVTADVVQDVYLQGKFAENCEELGMSLEKLKSYFNNTEPLSADQSAMVTLPKRVLHPTIGDLAVDRTLKLGPLKELLCK